MVIAVIDDYEQDRRSIAVNTERFLLEHNHSKPQFYYFSSGEEFITGLVPDFFDLVLLDCCMEKMDGLETAKMLRKVDKNTSLIFITSCRDYAVGGYLVSALGYLVKPYTYSSFSRVFENAYKRMSGKKDIILMKDGKEDKRILVDEIVYCDIEGHYVRIHLFNQPVVRVRMAFSSLAGILSPYPQFLECFRGCIINMAHTYKAEELNFLMDTGERVPFRKKEHGRLLQKYSNYLFDKVRSEGL